MTRRVTATRLKHRGLRHFCGRSSWAPQRQPVQDRRLDAGRARRNAGDRPAGSCRSSACLHLPFLLFSGYAGQLADVYSKRTVLIVTSRSKSWPPALGLFAFMSGQLNLIYAVCS